MGNQRLPGRIKPWGFVLCAGRQRRAERSCAGTEGRAGLTRTARFKWLEGRKKHSRVWDETYKCKMFTKVTVSDVFHRATKETRERRWELYCAKYCFVHVCHDNEVLNLIRHFTCREKKAQQDHKWVMSDRLVTQIQFIIIIIIIINVITIIIGSTRSYWGARKDWKQQQWKCKALSSVGISTARE